jgi:hypothetical protein
MVMCTVLSTFNPTMVLALPRHLLYCSVQFFYKQNRPREKGWVSGVTNPVKMCDTSNDCRWSQRDPDSMGSLDPDPGEKKLPTKTELITFIFEELDVLF